MFSGLSAFPLTPVNHHGIDERAYIRLIERLALANVDSIGALGSTGSYIYLSREERAKAASLAVNHAAGIPVIVGIGALRTDDVLRLAEDAQSSGAKGVLLSPVSYQKLTDDEVFGLYETVTCNLSVPLVVYDNPSTTNFTFSDELHGRIAHLPNVASIKIPGVPTDAKAASERILKLRDKIPNHVTIGISGDALAATGLNAGCEIWYSVIGGIFPNVALALTKAARTGDAALAIQLSDNLTALWNSFKNNGGSLRVVAAIAEEMGLVSAPSLPLPLHSIHGDEREKIVSLIRTLSLS